MTNINNNDSIDTRLAEAAEQLVASFSHLDTEAELRAVRDGSLPATWSYENHRRPRWLAAAAAVVLLGGAAAAAAVAMRSGNDSTPSISPTAGSTPTVTATSVPDTTMPGVGAPSDVFVTVSLSNSAVIEVRSATGVAASFDLSCPCLLYTSPSPRD